MDTAGYRPPRWLRDPHLQSVLSSSALRRRRGRRRLAAAGATTVEHVLDCGEARLQGFHSHRPGRDPAGLAVLLHGWEGSAESGYMLHTAARLLEAGFDVFRLNFRDHGATHHLNQEIFHSCRLDEVVAAVGQVADRIAQGPVHVAGHSLGGNFALRTGLHGPARGVRVAGVAAVCPVVNPAVGLAAMERSLWIYQSYFLLKWRRSLRRKRHLFPDLHGFDDRVLRQDMRGLTAWLVERYTDFGSLEAYLDGYSIAGDRLAGLQVPTAILTAADDPVIPVDCFRALSLPAQAQLHISEHGGHCGFIEDLRLDGFSERWIARQLAGGGRS